MAEKKTTKKATKKSSTSRAKTATTDGKKKATTAKAAAGTKKVKPTAKAPAGEVAKPATTSKPAGALQIKLVRSLIGSSPHQRAVVSGLGLRRLNQTVTRKDTREIRGMVAKVPHLVNILS